jgi:hypothetical protein
MELACTLRREAENRLVVLARPRASLAYVLMLATTMSVAREKRVFYAFHAFYEFFAFETHLLKCV